MLDVTKVILFQLLKYLHDKDGKMDQRNFAQHWRALAQFGQVYTNLEKRNNTYHKSRALTPLV